MGLPALAACQPTLTLHDGPRIKIGEPYGPFSGRIDHDAAIADAHATDDPKRRQSGNDERSRLVSPRQLDDPVDDEHDAEHCRRVEGEHVAVA